jgi:hypothetical protein
MQIVSCGKITSVDAPSGFDVIEYQKNDNNNCYYEIQKNRQNRDLYINRNGLFVFDHLNQCYQCTFQRCDCVCIISRLTKDQQDEFFGKEEVSIKYMFFQIVEDKIFGCYPGCDRNNLGKAAPRAKSSFIYGVVVCGILIVCAYLLKHLYYNSRNGV